MNKMFFKIGLGLLALAGFAWPSRGAVTGMKTLSGHHVPAVVSKLVPLGRLNATNVLHLAVGLPLHNQEALTNLLRQIYDPSNSDYRHYLTPGEFAARFGPTLADYEAVINFARTNGLKVEHTYGHRELVDLAGNVSDIERAFHVKMMTYHHPTEARDFYAPDTEPSVDASLPILAAQGMNNFILPHPMLHERPSGLPQPSIGTGPQGSYMGKDFRNAYIPRSPLNNGAGQIVGLLQFDGYFPSDIQTYENLAGLTNVPLQNVLLDGFNGQPGNNNGEVCLDIEMSISMAPALAGVVLFEGFIPDDILGTMVSSNQIKQFSASWGYGTDATSDQFYLQFALQGQTYFNASGDGDAWTTNGAEIGGAIVGSVEGTYETLVGGTTLTMNGVGASYASENAWNSGLVGPNAWNPDGFWGTSGGVSTDIAIPFYQRGINMVTNQGSTTFRNMPDVALTADNVFVVYNGGQQGIFFGTSCASPLWAGFMALVNQQAIANGEPTFGFLNPTVYALLQTTNYAIAFRDTVTGNNTWDQSPNKYFAVPGYDLCTGLGTPNGTNFLNVLTGTNGLPAPSVTPIFPAPKQPWGNTLSVMNGYNPNGVWLLFIQDDTLNNYAGTNYNGWSLNLTTANQVGYAADNQLYINATNVSVAPGGQWVTTLAVTNYGPSASTNVFVTDTLPSSGATLVSSSSSIPGSVITLFGDTLVWNAGNLPVNGGGTLSLTFQANSAGIYTNGAIVRATTPDPNPDDDSVGVNIAVAVSTPPVLAPYLARGGGGGFQLSVTNDAGSSVIIQASTNLLSWTPVYTNIAPFTFTNFDTTNYSQRFYRAVLGQ